MSSEAEHKAHPGNPDGNHPLPEGGRPRPSGQPIRIELPRTPHTTDSSPLETPVEDAEKCSPVVAVVLGLIAIATLLYSASTTLVFLLFGCLLALLHHELAHSGNSFERYSGFIPKAVGWLRIRLSKPDGKTILGVLLLAAVLFLLPVVVIGLVGGAAILTALFLLDLLDRPVHGLLRWHKRHEPSWSAALKSALKPAPCLFLAILSCAPSVYSLTAHLLPSRLISFSHYPLVTAAAFVVLLTLLLQRNPPQRDAVGPGDFQPLAHRTLVVSTVALTLSLCSLCIQLAYCIHVPLLSRWPAGNGVCLAVLPMIALWLWWSGYSRRQQVAATEESHPSPAAEQAGWQFSGLSSAGVAGLVFVLWRSAGLQGSGQDASGSLVLFAGALLAWFAIAMMTLGLARTGPGPRVPEWTVVHIATAVSMLLCFLLTNLAGTSGLVAAMASVVPVWKEGSRLLRQYQAEETATHAARQAIAPDPSAGSRS